MATKPQSSTTSVFTLHDQGPKITFLNPMMNGFVAVGRPVVVRFKVEPQSLGDQDDGAPIGELKASVGGKMVTNVEPSATEKDVYTFIVDFNDTTFFSAIPNTLSVRVDASNSREPAPRTVSANLAVGVDSRVRPLR